MRMHHNEVLTFNVVSLKSGSLQACAYYMYAALVSTGACGLSSMLLQTCEHRLVSSSIHNPEQLCC